MWVLLYGCTTWTLMKHLENKLEGNYTRMLDVVLIKLCQQHPRKMLHGHLPTILEIIQISQTRHTGHCWSSRDKLISNILLWTLTHGHTSVGWAAKTYIHQLYSDTRWNLAGMRTNRDGWQVSVQAEWLDDYNDDDDIWGKKYKRYCAYWTTFSFINIYKRCVQKILK